MILFFSPSTQGTHFKVHYTYVRAAGTGSYSPKWSPKFTNVRNYFFKGIVKDIVTP